MSTSIDVLFYFSSDSHDLLEAKINGLPVGTPPAQVYYWLLIDGATGEISRLAFEGMKSEDGMQYRTFEQGDLSFDAVQACLQLGDGAKPLTFATQSVEDMAQSLKDHVAGFLQG